MVVFLSFAPVVTAGVGAPPERTDVGATGHDAQWGVAQLGAAAAAERDADWPAADAAYRRAWEEPSTRQDAASGLRGLAARGLIGPTVDDRAVAATRKILGPDFLLTETRNFVLLSDADQAWTRQRAALLERSRHQYFRVMDRLDAPVYPHEHKLLCILFKGHDRYREFSRAEDGLRAAWMAGYFSPRTNRIVFYNDTTSPAYGEASQALEEGLATAKERRDEAAAARRANQGSRAAALEASATELEARMKRERSRLDDAAAVASTAKTLHESIHLLAFNTGLQSVSRDYPFWLSEGLAASFEADDPGSGAFGPDHGSAGRREGFVRARSEGRLMPLDELVGLTEVPAGTAAPGDGADAEADLAGVMYDESTALFMHLFRYRREELGGYFQVLLAQPETSLGPDGHRDLFVRAFGEPVALERKLVRE
jgi:hypothetical protein